MPFHLRPSRGKFIFPVGWLEMHYLSMGSGQEGWMEGRADGRVKTWEEWLQITSILSRERKIPGNMTTSNKYLQFNSLNKGGELFMLGQWVLAKGQGKENLV